MATINISTALPKIVLVVLSSICLAACGPKIVYAHFVDLPANGWHKDSVISFAFNVPDTTQTYDLMLYIRHTERYAYQNMWLFIGNGLNDTVLQADTIEFYLADDRGAWLGNRNNGHIIMPLLYESGIHIDACEQQLTIQHGLRDSLLQGILGVGVEVICNE